MSSPSQAGKWLPQYELKVETQPQKISSLLTSPVGSSRFLLENTVTIRLPLTLDFVVDRAFQAQAQKGNFKIKNLSPRVRDLLYKDPWNFSTFRAVQLRAGYPGYMPIIFNGNLLTGSSYRASGETDVTTELDCLDGQYAQQNGFTLAASGSYAGGPGAQTYAQIMNSLNATLPFIEAQPIIGNFPTVPVRGLALGGNTWNIIGQLSNNLATIDNGQLKVMQLNEVINAQIPVLNAESGMLGTPRRTGSGIEVDFMFEPRLTLGQIVELRSRTSSIFNGHYKVMGFTHRGTISAAVDGERRTTIFLWLGTAPLGMTNQFTTIAGNPVL